MSFVFTSESVSPGHPDKLCDQISDLILDHILSYEPDARGAFECFATKDRLIVGGECRVKNWDILKHSVLEEKIRNYLKYIGYDSDGFNYQDVKIDFLFHTQSPDIAIGVDETSDKPEGAGDQGIMFGYACTETPEYMPSAIYYAHKILETIWDLSKAGMIMPLGPDAKSQVSLVYNNEGKVEAVDSVTISIQHKECLSIPSIKNALLPIIKAVLPFNLPSDDRIFINPTGKFTIGGPVSDTGLTGRKIIVDTYGGYAPHGGGAFCVDGDTEYFCETGWRKISEYNGGKVAQWDKGIVSLVHPEQYINTKADIMYRISSMTKDMVLSENHDIVYYTSKGNLRKKKTKDVLSQHLHTILGFSGRIPVHFNYDNHNKGVDLTDSQIRLQIAFCADGTLFSNSQNLKCKGRVRVKKEYKKNRMRELLHISNTTYREAQNGAFTIFYFNPPCLSKSLFNIFANANNYQYNIIADEVLKWDRDFAKKIYRTTIKQDADFIQFVFQAVTGCASSILIDNRTGKLYGSGTKKYIRKSIHYSVYQKQNKTIGFKTKNQQDKITIEKFITDRMYCFSVPSGMLLLRRNNKIFITGNSGKDGTKVDRSGAYMARFLAKNIVASGIATKCTIQLSYVIGVSYPISINIDCANTLNSNITTQDVIQFIKNNVDLSPKGIRTFLKLNNPIYLKTATFGHFGREAKDGFFTWEELSLVDEIKTYFNI